MTIISVQDGDTFTARLCSSCQRAVRIRLADIDAPERGEPLWHASRSALRNLLQWPRLHLEPTRRQEDVPDPHNRLVGYIWSGPELLQARLVHAGMAAVYTPRGPNQHTIQLLHYEELARSRREGIWSIPSHRLCQGFDLMHG